MRTFFVLLFLIVSSLQAKEWYVNAWSDFKEVNGQKAYKYSFEKNNNKFSGSTVKDVINSAINHNDPEYPIFVVYRESDDKTAITQTIDKSAGDRTTFNVGNRELNYVAENLDDNQNSFLIGNVDTNFGISGGVWVKKAIKRINNKYYVMFLAGKINFNETLLASATVWCKKNNYNDNFRLIYNSPAATRALDKTNNGNINDTGIFSIPCSTIKNSKEFPNIEFEFKKPLEGWGNNEVIKVKNLITDNGNILNLPHLNGSTTFFSSLSFFGNVMDRYNIDTGIIVRTNEMDIKTHQWRRGKCRKFGGGHKTFYAKKSIIQSSEIYTLESLPMLLPFEENRASISSNDNSLKLSPFAPVDAMPSDKTTILNVTPDNHLQAYALLQGSKLVENEIKGKQQSVIVNTVKKKKGCGFNLFKAILGALLIVLTIALPYLGVPLSVGIFTFSLGYGLLISAWPGAHVSGINQIVERVKFSEYISIKDAKNSGSVLYESFANLRNVMSQLPETQSMFDPKKFKTLVDKSQNYNKTGGKLKYENENYINLADYLLYNHGKEKVYGVMHFYQPTGADIPFATRDLGVVYNKTPYGEGIIIGEANLRDTIKKYITGETTSDADVFNTSLIAETIAKKLYPEELNEN